MRKISIASFIYEDNFIYLSEEDAKKYRPEAIKTWEFDCAPYLTQTVIEVGRLINQARLTDERGLGDADAIEIARAKFAVQLLVKEWSRQTETGEALPITPENIGTLPVGVLRALYLRLERGAQPTQAEADAMRLPI